MSRYATEYMDSHEQVASPMGREEEGGGGGGGGRCWWRGFFAGLRPVVERWERMVRGFASGWRGRGFGSPRGDRSWGCWLGCIWGGWGRLWRIGTGWSNIVRQSERRAGGWRYRSGLVLNYSAFHLCDCKPGTGKISLHGFHWTDEEGCLEGWETECRRELPWLIYLRSVLIASLYCLTKRRWGLAHDWRFPTWGTWLYLRRLRWQVNRSMLRYQQISVHSSNESPRSAHTSLYSQKELGDTKPHREREDAEVNNDCLIGCDEKWWQMPPMCARFLKGAVSSGHPAISVVRPLLQIRQPRRDRLLPLQLTQPSYIDQCCPAQTGWCDCLLGWDGRDLAQDQSLVSAGFRTASSWQ